MRRLLVLLILALAFIATPVRDASADGPRLCHSGHIDNVDVLLLGPLAHISRFRYGITDAALIKAILALHGRETWVGYERGGFDPITTYWDGFFIVNWNDAQGYHSNWLWFGHAADETKRQIYWFPTMDQYTGEDGKHMGAHPICGWHAIEVSALTVDHLLELAGIN